MADEFSEGLINKPKDISTYNRLETKNNPKLFFPRSPFPICKDEKESMNEVNENTLTKINPQNKVRTLRISIFENAKKLTKETSSNECKELSKDMLKE